MNDNASRSLSIATARSKTARWSTRETTWPEFVGWLKLDRPGDEKDCGCYVFGALTGPRRTNETVRSRSGVTLDPDHITTDVDTFIKEVRRELGDATLAWHTTFSHTDDSPRCRVVVPLRRDVSGAEYERLTKAIIARLGVEQVDPASASPAQFMYRPAAGDRDAYDWGTVEGHLLDPDEWIGDEPATPAAEYVGQAYDNLTDGERAMAAREVDRRVSDLRERLADAADWPEGQTDDKLRGWESLARDAAWSLAVIAATPWSGVDEQRAHELYDDLLPDVIAADEKCAGKWRDDLVAKAERQGDTMGAPPWDGFAEALAEAESATDATGSGWQRRDLTAVVSGILTGEVARLTPTVGQRTDGQGLFYRGKVNGLAAPSGGGKTWVALATCAQELAAGGAALYIDLEENEYSTVQRLLDLGADPGVVVERFVYVRPDDPFSKAAAESVRGLLADLHPTVAVLDSTGELMALDGTKPNDDDAVAVWFRQLPRLIAESGAAVILLDHQAKSAKDEDGSNMWALGSQRKRAAISGAQYVMQVKEPFDKGSAGYSQIVSAKDRHGTYRTGSVVADFHVTPYDDGTVSMSFDVPPEPSTPQERNDAVREEVCRFIRQGEDDGGPGVVTSKIKNGVKRKSTDVVKQLDWLVANEFVSRTYIGQGAYHRVVKDYAVVVDFPAEE